MHHRTLKKRMIFFWKTSVGDVSVFWTEERMKRQFGSLSHEKCFPRDVNLSTMNILSPIKRRSDPTITQHFQTSLDGWGSILQQTLMYSPHTASTLSTKSANSTLAHRNRSSNTIKTFVVQNITFQFSKSSAPFWYFVASDDMKPCVISDEY